MGNNLEGRFMQIVKDEAGATTHREFLLNIMTKAYYMDREWVDVKERLPDDKTRVICCNEKGTYIDSFEYDARMNLFLSFQYPFGVRDVTHWQPLPQKPGKEGEV